MRALKLSVLSVVVAAFAYAQGGATVVTKETTGEAAIVNKDEAKAFEDAKAQALRSAVEQAAGVRIDADSVVVNNQLVRDQVFANTSGYVKKFDVVSKKVDKGVVSVALKVEVITENLDKDITAARDLVKRMGRPSIVIVVQEQTIPISEKVMTSTEVMATVLTDVFRNDGWDIRDAHAMNKKLKLEGGATFGSTEVKEIADLTKAQYLLYGKAIIRHQDPGPMATAGAGQAQSYFPVSGEYNLTLASTDSEQDLAKISNKLVMDARKNELLTSYERSAFTVIMARKEEITGPVRKAILEHLRNKQVNGSEIALEVSGLDSLGAAKDFKRSMEAMKGIKEAQQVKFDQGKASYRVTFLGSADELAESVEAATFKKKKVKVLSQTANTVAVQIGK